MMQKLFVDTNILCAINNPQDSLHSRALKIISFVTAFNPIISNFILLETYTILSQRVSRSVSIKFGESIVKDKVFTIVWIDQLFEPDVWKIFCKIKDKNFSYVDASILAIMQREKIKHLLSFDDSFKNLQTKFNFKLIPE